MFNLIVLLALACVCSTTPIGQQKNILPGACPKVTTKSDFDFARYYGNWYEIAKTSGMVFEKNQKCIAANYEPKANDTGVATVTSSAINTGTNQPTNSGGRLFQTDKTNPGKLLISYIPGADSIAILAGNSYLVLDTDYTSYTVVHSCTNYLGMFHSQLNWILARGRVIDADTMAKANKVFADNGVNTDALVQSDQTGCN